MSVPWASNSGLLSPRLTATGWACWCFALPAAGCAPATAGSVGARNNAAAVCRCWSTTAASCCWRTKPSPISPPVRLRLCSATASAPIGNDRYGHPVVLVGNFCRSRTVLRHCLYRQRLAGIGNDRRLRPGAPRLLPPAQQTQAAVRARTLPPTPVAAFAADKLKPTLARVEAKTRPRSTQTPAQIHSLVRIPQGPARLSGSHRHLPLVELARHRRAGPPVRRPQGPERPGQVRQGAEPVANAAPWAFDSKTTAPILPPASPPFAA